MTLPAATVVLDCMVTVPTTRPAPVIAVVAAAWVSVTTLGTDTGAGPDETMRFMAGPLDQLVPATGLSLMMSPAATVLLACIVIVPTVRPAAVIAAVAAAWVSPCTLGSLTWEGALPPPPPPPHAASTKGIVATAMRSNAEAFRKAHIAPRPECSSNLLFIVPTSISIVSSLFLSQRHRIPRVALSLHDLIPAEY